MPAGRPLAVEPAERASPTVVVEGRQGRGRLRAPSATALFVYEPDGSVVERPFTCGPQRLGVRARFRADAAGAAGGRAAPDGTLLSLTLQAP